MVILSKPISVIFKSFYVILCEIITAVNALSKIYNGYHHRWYENQLFEHFDNSCFAQYSALRQLYKLKYKV